MKADIRKNMLRMTAALLSLSVCLCGAGSRAGAHSVYAADAGEEIPEDLTGGSPWIDACIPGNVTPDTKTSAADDFYLYANKDWIIANELPEGSPIMEFDLCAGVRARVRDALDGDALSGHDARQAQLLFAAFADTEALAEICGMQARLTYAAGQDGFDYRKFFETRARLAASLYTPEYALACIMGMDSHPLAYLDTNVTFQQFDEFQETFDVKKGDAMYLAPEDRLVIW